MKAIEIYMLKRDWTWALYIVAVIPALMFLGLKRGLGYTVRSVAHGWTKRGNIRKDRSGHAAPPPSQPWRTDWVEASHTKTSPNCEGKADV
jgi:hypothetical protein